MSARAMLLVAVLSVLPATLARADDVTIKDKRLAACFADMQRLCAGYPDKRKLKTCIRPKRALVSDRCRAWLDAPG